MAKRKTHLKYFKKVIYRGDNTLIFAKRERTSKKLLFKLLKNRPMTRREIIDKTNWTRGQIAGIIFRGKKEGKLKLKNGLISIIKTQ